MPTDPAAIFLLVCAALFVPLFALPLLFAPLAWARAFRWSIPAERNLTLYFGRCLGGLALAVAAFVLRAVFEPLLRDTMLEILVVAFAMMVAVHVWGALRKQQPWTETVEILFYLGLALAAAWFRWR